MASHNITFDEDQMPPIKTHSSDDASGKDAGPTGANITFDEDQLRPVRTHVSAKTSGADLDQGIVFGRTVSMARDGSRSRSFNRRFRRGSRSSRSMTRDEEDGETTTTPTDYRVKQVFHGRQLASLALGSIGVIYGDIGTSPLYVFSSGFSSEPSNADLVGFLSLILWSLLLMVTLKYIIIILRADNLGEGGTFSTYSFIGRYANIVSIDPKEKALRQIERWPDEEMPTFNRKFRKLLEDSHFVRTLLKTTAVLAVCAVISDGILTPAQSVLGATQGLSVAVPSITNAQIVGATVGILVALFALQPLGVNKISLLFSPLIIIWLGFIGGIGLYNIIVYDYTVLRAFSPYFAFEFLIRNGRDGWLSLGSVLLAFTALEALFADLGAFSQRAIQLSWFLWALPMLLLTYVGQAAYISVNPAAYTNPVFTTAPNGLVIPLLVLAVIAAIIASEATIIAAYNLISQLNKLSYLPPVSVQHKSKTHFNQIYVSTVNWLIMVATVLVAAIANNTTTLSYAYGACVALVTFLDTIMVSIVAIVVWRLRWWVILPVFLVFICLDGAFLSSALTKVPDGAWFTLTLAGVLASAFLLWRYGKEQQWTAEATDRVPISRFIKQSDDKLQLVRYDLEEIQQLKGFTVFMDKVGDRCPIVFSQFVEKLVIKPEVTIFLSLRALETPTIAVEERYWVTKMRLPGTYRVLVRYGFMDEVITNDLAGIVYQQVRRYIISQGIDRSAPALAEARKLDMEEKGNEKIIQDNQTEESSEEISQELAQLDQAYGLRVTYVVGKEDLHVRPSSNFFRKIVLSIFLFVKLNTRQKIEQLNLPRDHLVEIGFVKEF